MSHEWNLAQVGGKALPLFELSDRGLPVPPFFVIPTRIFRDQLLKAGLRQSKSREILHRIPSLSLPEELVQSWIRRAKELGGTVAVRSSGVDEDGVGKSFAGQHLTVLGVRPEDVPAAVLRCWASLYDERVLAYRNGKVPLGGLAVVIQKQIEPHCSGVLFTINPQNGSWREMVVESVFGLGEGLVQGVITPHFYRVRRPRRTPALIRRRLPQVVHRLAGRVRLTIMERDEPAQPKYWTHKGLQRTPSSLVNQPTLSNRQLRALCRLALRAESFQEGPTDMEWALDEQGKLWVLQARPITASGDPRKRATLWTRRFLGERWPTPATPLGWSVLAPILDYFIAYPEVSRKFLGGEGAIRLFHGRPYVNATVFRHLAFKLPGSPPPQFMLELIPPDEEAAWKTRFAVAPDLQVYQAIFKTTFEERRWQRFSFNPLNNAIDWAAFRDELVSQLSTLSAKIHSEEEGFARLTIQEAWITRYCGIHLCSLLFANIGYQVLEGLIATHHPKNAAAYLEALTRCPPGNPTVRTNEALAKLAALGSEEDYEALSHNKPTSEAFSLALEEFLSEFGHRSEASWELMAPRWRSDPARLVPILRAQGKRQPTTLTQHDPEEVQRSLIQSLNPALRSVANAFVNSTRTYLSLREEQRFYFDHLLSATQNTLLEMGAFLVERGKLDTAGDVQFLTIKELKKKVGDQALVAERRAQWLEYHRHQPPVFYVGRRAVHHAPVAAGRRQPGLGISAGRASGPARVVRSLSDVSALKPGEILVASVIDPGWTSLLTVASGLVVEMGGMLSHGAVVAREYGLPAVGNIEGITGQIRTGQWMTVDGTRGFISVGE